MVAAAALAALASCGGGAAYDGARWPITASFPTDDGGVVFADVYGDGQRGVVLAHGARFTKESWADQAPVLAREGLRVVAIDFRGHGRSHGPGGVDDQDEAHRDVLAAVRYLRGGGATSVAVVGASFGGWAAARASLEAPGTIDELALLAASPVADPEHLAGRKLFVVARDDLQGAGTPRLPIVRDQFERAPEPKELLVLEGGAHAQFLFETDQGQRLLDALARFLTAGP